MKKDNGKKKNYTGTENQIFTSVFVINTVIHVILIISKNDEI